MLSLTPVTADAAAPDGPLPPSSAPIASPPIELLPTRKRAWEFYRDFRRDCEQKSLAAWCEGERWLGRADLFYLLVCLLRRADINRDWLYERVREVEAQPDGRLDLWARGHYKDLADDTPVLTRNRGWVEHGALEVGDLVYDDYGRPRAVLAVSVGYTDSECYRLTFSDGVSVVAGAGHLWRVRRKSRLRVGDWRVGRRAVQWSEEVTPTYALPERADIGVLRCAVEGIPQQLPADPYLLGAWLGDGTLASSSVTVGFADAAETEARLRSRGVDVRRKAYSRYVRLQLGNGVRGKKGSSDFRNALRAAGVLKDKHIPAVYQSASAHQRMELLRGLMDTDGHCDTRGTATFVNVNKRLAEGVFELATGLALRPRFRSYRHGTGPYAGREYHTVVMQSHVDRCPFALRRKAERCVKVVPPHRDFRDLVSMERVAPVPTRCIQVEGGAYLATRALIPTHNSTLITFGLTIRDILRDPEITVGIFSHTRPTAKGFLRQIKMELELNHYLVALYGDVLYRFPSKDSPKWSEDEGIVVKRQSNPKEATVEAWGLVDGQPTGRHFRLRVYDDVVTRESVTTSDQISKTTTAIDLSDNLGVPAEAGGRARYIGTRYNLADTYATLMQRRAVVPRVYPATHNGRFDGRPVFLTDEEWASKLRTQSRTVVAAQLLQNPMADEEASFRPEWLRSYEIRPRTLNVFIMADPSRGRSADSDNTAVSVVGLASNGAKFLLDGVCHRMTLSQRWIALRTMYHRWRRQPGVQRVAVGYERYGAQSDDEYFQEQMAIEQKRKVEGAVFPIVELNWPREGGGSKRERVERLEPDFRNSRFYLPLPVWRDGAAATWRVQTDPDGKDFGAVEWRPASGPSAVQRDAIEGGMGEYLARAIKCRDQEGKLYDLTEHFIEEYLTFPFGAYKDLIDATSRIYDMNAVPPVVLKAEDTEPRAYWDR